MGKDARMNPRSEEWTPTQAQQQVIFARAIIQLQAIVLRGFWGRLLWLVLGR